MTARARIAAVSSFLIGAVPFPGKARMQRSPRRRHVVRRSDTSRLNAVTLVNRNRGNHNERMPALEESIRNFARILGFNLVGIAPAVEADGFDRLRDWLDRGYAGEMAYMGQYANARRH